jgi:transcriptional regulator
LADGKKSTVGLKNNVSLLSEISIYTHEGEVKLFDVFKSIATKENNEEAISHKVNNPELVAYFKEVLPDYDEERVYVSDIKKVINWYNILQKRGMIENTFSETEEVKAEEN